VSAPRRIVTTTDASGRSAVESDGAPSAPGPRLTVLWEARTPVDHDDMGGDPGAATGLPDPGTARFVRLVLPAGGADAGDPGALSVPLHRTDTLDLLYVASGEVDLVLESGRVHLAAGDHLVMQGDVHGWRTTGPDDCVLVAVMLGAPARPDKGEP